MKKTCVFKKAYKTIYPTKYLNGDLNTWLALTKIQMFNPIAFLLGWKDGKFIVGSMVISWILHWKQILFGPTYCLYAPKPSLAAHMEKNCMPIEW